VGYELHFFPKGASVSGGSGAVAHSELYKVAMGRGRGGGSRAIVHQPAYLHATTAVCKLDSGSEL